MVYTVVPLQRFDRLDETQKHKLLDAATSEFAREGYAEASLNRILKAAGLSKGSLYYYFTDRDDLYAYVVLRAMQSMAADLALDTFAPKTAEEFETGLTRMAHRSAELFARFPERMRAVRSFQRDLRRNAKPAFAPVIELMQHTFTDIVRRGRKLNAVRSDVPEALLVELMEAVDEVMDRALFDGDTLPTKRALTAHVARSVDMFRRLLLPAATSTRKGRSS